MKFSLSWLKYYLQSDADANQIAAALNNIGLEVEGVENPADKLSDFRVGKVLSAAPHPQADKLQILSVDAGDGPKQVVCGAPNARAGMLGVFGPAGATVPSNGMMLKVAEIRGVESNGMMCSIAELELGDDHDGIIELPDDAPVGDRYADYAKLDDPIFDVSITPNRQDCMGVMGIARDLAAAGYGEFKPVIVPEISGDYPCPIEIEIADKDGCPAFYGRVIRGVKNGPSPKWLQDRLKAAGQRPISALVDITNYLMFACGRPAHIYDLSKLTGKITARRANEGEEVLALNEKTYKLNSSMTVIADDAGVHDIAGIMGGEHSGCSDETTDILLEIAYFTPENIAKTGQALTLTSDARTRFERGVDPAFLDDGMMLLTDLVLQICGGEASEIVRAGTPPVKPRQIDFDTGLTLILGGVNVTSAQQKEILQKLGFDIDAKWNVTIPSWRRDIDGAADLVEEVVRMVGLDKVPSTPLPRADGVARPTATPLQKLERKMRRSAASRGMNEAINWSFLPEKEANAFGGGAWTLANPISEDMKVMRTSILPGLLSAARRNMDRGALSVRLFEIGRRYFRAKDGSSDERLTLGMVMAGDKNARHWASGKAGKFDAYDAKAEAMALLSAAGVATDNLMIMGDAGAHFHPGQSGTLRMGPKNILASFGTLHPLTAKAFDLDGPVVAAEIYLDSIPAKKGVGAFMRAPYAPPALQAVKRDFAFLFPNDGQAYQLERAIRGCDKQHVKDARIFDAFTGNGVPEGQVSIAIEVTLQPQDKSFTDDELKSLSDKIIAAAAKNGGLLRT
ncbi:phenylalanine--tRNA ligase subunit beta [Sphingorhabdus lutea]|uniref:Phenylalanine--tRNA ligase beta subunit n=1 Tax=Sphingorhabdus lutea TaxID=1913578 RepID=A0A1L3J9Q0_9SPHN|nr:phenylalanine--tRNA ligase subunit beta [Sphingorhabdus lutea]APG61857.1 phenylalanine--tRNA ligase subunit beta [Sphingorhabdus lutea]